jgi:type VI secretion system protein ImpK
VKDDTLPQTFEVLLYGLALRDRVARGDRPHLGTEQGKLKALLGSGSAPPPWGNGVDPTAGSIAMGGADREFLGVRYAFTCWLDEILIDAGWREWDENKLESALYRMNVRYGNFWQQARLTESVPSAAPALEAFLLCVLLGFRGEMGETPDRLREWVQNTRARVTRRLGKEPAALPERAAVSDVPLLLGSESYRRMTRWLVAGILFGVPVVAFLVVVLAS